eukprot:scaffold100_cov323-Pavlova_lutheri.AAC.2
MAPRTMRDGETWRRDAPPVRPATPLPGERCVPPMLPIAPPKRAGDPGAIRSAVPKFDAPPADPRCDDVRPPNAGPSRPVPPGASPGRDAGPPAAIREKTAPAASARTWPGGPRRAIPRLATPREAPPPVFASSGSRPGAAGRSLRQTGTPPSSRLRTLPSRARLAANGTGARPPSPPWRGAPPAPGPSPRPPPASRKLAPVEIPPAGRGGRPGALPCRSWRREARAPRPPRAIARCDGGAGGRAFGTRPP